MNSKKWIKIFGILSFLCIGFIIGLNLIIDPLKLFHKPLFLKNKLNSNMRLQAAGLIRNSNFDSIILGTSMLENTSSKEASNVLNTKFVNISLSGSDFYERSFILKNALALKQLKKIIYSLDYGGLIRSERGRENFPIENFNFLYDKNRFNDLKQYLNLELPICLIKMNFDPCFGREVNFDTPNEWFSNLDQSSRFGGIDNWFKAKNNAQIKDAFKEIQNSINAIKNNETKVDNNIKYKIKESEKYLENYILKFVKNNPNTEFNLVIPPYSRIQNAINAQYKKSDFIRIKKSIKFLVKSSDKYPNLKIYGWGDRDFPSDISLYKDLAHYHPKINSKMLYWIKENNGLLTVDNIDNYLNIFEKKSLNYDLQIIGTKINAYLNNNGKTKL